MAQVRMTTITPQPLSADAWAPFGWLPVPDTDPADGSRTLHFEWGDPHLNVIAHTPDEVERTERGLVCAGLYRHATHTQALMPIDCDAVLAVAAPGTDFTAPGAIDGVRAFRLAPLDVFVLERSTWHWGPFPVGDEPVRLLNVQGLRYREDNEFADLAALGGTVLEVVTA